MGLDYIAGACLVGSVEQHGPLGRTLTLGRQWLIGDPGRLLKRMASRAPADGVLKTRENFADPFLAALGADLSVMDASDYEGAAIVHDMNEPVPESMKGSFDTVIDGGTTEHVFNFPQALRNLMELVAVGGRLFTFPPTNNNSGHGFYQISPELYFRAFSEENGFRINRLAAFEWGGSRVYEIADPNSLRRRVEITKGRRGVLLAVEATRIASVPIFGKWPQQSDYSAAWTGESTSRKASFEPPTIAQRLLRPIVYWLRDPRGIKRSLRDPESFRPASP